MEAAGIICRHLCSHGWWLMLAVGSDLRWRNWLKSKYGLPVWPELPHSMALQDSWTFYMVPQASKLGYFSKQSWSYVAFPDVAIQVTHCHFYCIILVRNQSFKLVQFQREGTLTSLLNGRNVKEFVNMFITTIMYHSALWSFSPK